MRKPLAAFDQADLADLFAAFNRSGMGEETHQPVPARGQDVDINAFVSLAQIHGGGEIEVRASLPEPDAQVRRHRVSRTFRISVPLCAAHGKRGLRAEDGSAGALHAVIVIKVPSIVSDGERTLYQQRAGTSEFHARPHFAEGDQQ